MTKDSKRFPVIPVGFLVMEAKEKEIYESQRHGMGELSDGIHHLWIQCSWLSK